MLRRNDTPRSILAAGSIAAQAPGVINGQPLAAAVKLS